MSAEGKVRIYKTAVRPVLTYAMETRVDKAKTKNMRRVPEMKTLRTIKKVSLRHSTVYEGDRMILDRLRRQTKNKELNSKRPNLADLSRDGASIGYLLHRRLNNVKKSKRNNIKS
ncbi:hypothetical protein Trydic_g7115 [Trypoxylus dichotomus]